MLRKVLLICGVLAALLYVGSDIFSAMSWKEYSFTNQSVSELRAIGAPTRPFLVPCLLMYAVLEIAFGSAVWGAAGQERALRIAGVLLIGLGVVDLTGPFFPMHLRENLRETGRTLTDTVHIIVTVVTVLLILLTIAFGATALGKRFRLYSFATIIVLMVSGVWAFLAAPQIEANLSTPWLGVRERINIYGYMLWMLVLAIGLLRIQGSRSSVTLPRHA
jgi:hypothetical protein